MNFGLDALLKRRNFKESRKEDCFCAVAIYTNNVLAEEIPFLLWKTEQKACTDRPR